MDIFASFPCREKHRQRHHSPAKKTSLSAHPRSGRTLSLAPFLVVQKGVVIAPFLAKKDVINAIPWPSRASLTAPFPGKEKHRHRRHSVAKKDNFIGTTPRSKRTLSLAPGPKGRRNRTIHWPRRTSSTPFPGREGHGHRHGSLEKDIVMALSWPRSH
jgi:hypothetical protein